MVWNSRTSLDLMKKTGIPYDGLKLMDGLEIELSGYGLTCDGLK